MQSFSEQTLVSIQNPQNMIYVNPKMGLQKKKTF